MDENARYVRLGLFVLLAAGMLLAGIGILGSGLFAPERTLAETYLDESVQGLAEGLPVKARGVTVGRIEEIGFAFMKYGNTRDPVRKYDELIRIVVSLDNSRLAITAERLQRFIEEGMRIRLAMAGLTGVAYLEIDMADPARYPFKTLPWEPEHLYIPSRPSTSRQFLDSLDTLMTQLEAAQLDKVGGDLRVLMASLTRTVNEDLAPALKELKGVAAGVPGTQARIDALVASIDRLVAQVGTALDRDVRPAVASVSEAAKEATPVLRDASRVVRRADLLLAGKRETLAEILENLRAATDELRLLVGQLRRNPGGVILGEPPPRKEAK